jgi:hypothetical protein
MIHPSRILLRKKRNRLIIMSDISEKVVLISANYLGPAARKFLQRQTSGHMNGLNLDDLERKDLPALARWIQTSASLVIDPAKARELADKIAKI